MKDKEKTEEKMTGTLLLINKDAQIRLFLVNEKVLFSLRSNLQIYSIKITGKICFRFFLSG